MDNNRHYAVIDAYNRKVTFIFEGTTIAETSNAKILKEVGKSVYNPVLYIPKEDIKIDLIPEPTRQSYCPIKGDASYWTIEGNTKENYFAWSYEEPIARSKKIKGLVAFNMDYITTISEPIL